MDSSWKITNASLLPTKIFSSFKSPWTKPRSCKAFRPEVMSNIILYLAFSAGIILEMFSQKSTRSKSSMLWKYSRTQYKLKDCSWGLWRTLKIEPWCLIRFLWHWGITLFSSLIISVLSLKYFTIISLLLKCSMCFIAISPSWISRNLDFKFPVGIPL